MGRITWQECSNRAQSWGEIHSATGRQFERKLAQGKRLKRRQFCLSEGRNSLEEKKKKKKKHRLEGKEEEKWLSIIHVIFPYQSLQMMNRCNKSQYSIFPIYMERRP